MILLDHNIPQDHARQLRRWRIRCEQVGYAVGRPEWDDQQEILRYLHSRKQVTFVTRDLGFFRRKFCHAGHCIVIVVGSALETGALVRSFLRHPQFRTKSQRLGCIAQLSRDRIVVLRVGQAQRSSVSWSDRGARQEAQPLRD